MVVCAQAMVIRLAAVLALVTPLALPARTSAQGRPDCAEVLRKLHAPKVVARGGGHTPDANRVAQMLHVDADYVERCAQAYGRRVTRHVSPGQADKVEAATDLAEKREVEEYEELSREEKDTLGDKYVTVIENDESDRKKVEHNRDADTVNEWEPYETHEWQPFETHVWEPVMPEDDE